MNDNRRLKLREYNLLREELKTLTRKLERMEAHEGDDGTAEDIDGEVKLVEEIAEKTRRLRTLRKEIYP